MGMPESEFLKLLNNIDSLQDTLYPLAYGPDDECIEVANLNPSRSILMLVGDEIMHIYALYYNWNDPIQLQCWENEGGSIHYVSA